MLVADLILILFMQSQPDYRAVHDGAYDVAEKSQAGAGEQREERQQPELAECTRIAASSQSCGYECPAQSKDKHRKMQDDGAEAERERPFVRSRFRAA